MKSAKVNKLDFARFWLMDQMMSYPLAEMYMPEALQHQIFAYNAIIEGLCEKLERAANEEESRITKKQNAGRRSE